MKHSDFRQEAGYSLMEVLVATTLLLTVLVPLGGVGLYLAAWDRNARESTALAYGQQVMEEALYSRSYESGTTWLEDGRWRIEKAVTIEEVRVTLVVRVFYRTESEPLMVLMTMRLLA